MRRAKIVTDGTSELPPSVVQQLGIEVLSVQIKIQRQIVSETPDMYAPAFHQANLRASVSPNMVPPSQDDFASVYARLAKETDRIISVHSTASGANTVIPAQRAAGGLLGRVHVDIVDCQFTSWPMGLIVQEGARALADGASGEQAVRLVRRLISRTYFAFYVDNLTALRTDHTEGVAIPRRSSANKAQPLLLLEDGKIIPQFAKRKKGPVLDRLVDFVSEFQQPEQLAIVHSGLMPDVVALRDTLVEANYSFEEHIYGPPLASLIGPKAVGIVVLDKQPSQSSRGLILSR